MQKPKLLKFNSNKYFTEFNGKLMKSKVYIEGVFKSSINLNRGKVVDFKNGLTLYFADLVDNDLREFIVAGECTETLDLDYLGKFIELAMKEVIVWLSFCFDSPAFSLNIRRVSIVRGGLISGHGHSTSVSSVSARKGPTKTELKRRKIFEKEFLKHFSKTPLPIFFYNKAVSEENDFARFWYFYIILQILIGDRSVIKRFLLTNYRMPTGINNLGERVPILISIRDAFSHNVVTFNGRKIDLEKDLNKNMPSFQKIVRDIIKKKFKLDVRL